MTGLRNAVHSKPGTLDALRMRLHTEEWLKCRKATAVAAVPLQPVAETMQLKGEDPMTEDLFERAHEAFFGTGKTLPDPDKSASLNVAPSHEKPVASMPVDPINLALHR